MPRLKEPPSRKAAAAVADAETTDVLAQNDPALEPDDGVIALEGDDPSLAFQKQIEELRKAEQIQRERAEQYAKEREEAIQRAKDRETENLQLKRASTTSQVEAVSNAIAAANAAAAQAMSDIEKASELGDAKGMAEAYNRLSRANVDLARLESGKATLEAEAKAAQEAKVQTVDPIDGLNIPYTAKEWLRAHPEYLTNERLNAKLNAIHHDLVYEGIAAYSQQYLDQAEIRLGLKAPPQLDKQDDEVEPQQRQRPSMVSAPVSRDTPSVGGGDRPGKVTLTVAQKEAAKTAGVTEEEYAKGVLRLRQEKLNGNYGGAP